LIDHVSFPGSLPEDLSRFDPDSLQSWIPKCTNLKHLYDALSIFLIETCGHALPAFEDASGRKVNPDLKAIAQHDSLPDVVLLLKLCVVAAVNGPERIRFLEPMQELPESVQRVLMETLQEVQTAHEDHGEDNAPSADEDQAEYTEEESYPVETSLERPAEQRPPSAGAPTSDLAFEERLAKVIADSQRIAHEKRELQRHIDDLNTRFITLQESYTRAQDELSEANDRLSAVLSGRTKSTKESTDAQKEALIASLEARIAEYEADIEGLRKNNEVLKIRAEKTQKLQDDYDEIKIERDNFARKANAAEKYRQKLETTQEMERENSSLKQKITDLQAQLRQYDTRVVGEGNLAREVDEYRRLLPAIEQERHEVNEMKKRLEFDYHVLQTRYGESEDQLRRARQEVEDLQERIREDDDGHTRPSRRTTEGEGEEDGETVPEEDDTDAQELESSEADFAAAEARLTEALLKDNDSNTANVESNEDENGISEAELRAIMSAIRAQMHVGTAHERESGMKLQKKLVVMLEKARTKNVALVEHTKKQSELIQELQSRPVVPDKQDQEPKEPRSESGMEQQLEEQDELIDNLKREIRLMSSAWYEQNQRLATLGSGAGGGAVALMRLKGGQGLEEPKSFLGRQRKMIDRAMIGANVRTTRG